MLSLDNDDDLELITTLVANAILAEQGKPLIAASVDPGLVSDEVSEVEGD